MLTTLKNLGVTDTTLAVVRKDLLTEVPPTSFLHAVGVWSPPTILNWPVIAKNNSLYNTMVGLSQIKDIALWLTQGAANLFDLDFKAGHRFSRS